MYRVRIVCHLSMIRIECDKLYVFIVVVDWIC